MLRVTHKMLANSVSRNIQRNLIVLERRSNQLSMGKLFDRPSQDPGGVYKAMKIASTGLARNNQYSRNIGEGISWLNSTEGALAESIDVLQRLRELAVYAANDTLSPADRRQLAPEVQQLLEHLISLGNTDLGGLYIFGGHKTLEPPYRVAGASGELINDWYNPKAGLAEDSPLIIDNMITGDYAISTQDGAPFTDDPSAYLVEEYLQGARDGFFGGGADGINTLYNSEEDGTYISDSQWNGSVALEIQESKKFGQFSPALQDAIQEQVGDADEQDLIIRLSAGYQLYDLDGTSNSGSYGNKAGEDIYINMTQLKQEEQSITFQVGEDEWITMEVPPNANITYEKEEVKVGDKAVFQLRPGIDGDYDVFTLHRNYGQLDEQGYPTTGDALDWYFEPGFFNGEDEGEEKLSTLKFFDIDPATGQFITSNLQVRFEELQEAYAQAYRDLEEIQKHGVPDEDFPEYPAAIFSFIAPGDPYYMGDDGERLVEITPGQTVPVNITGLEAFGGTDLFQAVRDMHQALMHDKKGALGGEILEKFDGQLDHLLRYRSEIGARMERLEVTDERLHTERIYLREQLSRVEDIDMAEAITEFMMQENAYNAALATGARIVYPSLIDFLR